MNFDSFYSKQQYYFGQNYSVGLAECLKKYKVPSCLTVDLGAGEGRNSLYLAKLGFDVVAIEPSKVGAQKITEQSKESGLKIKVLNSDFLSCVDKLKDIGLLVALTSLEHMEYNYMLESVKTIKQILQICGYVYIIAFTEDDPAFRNDMENASECASFVQHYFKKNELRDLFSDFEILHYSECIKKDTNHGTLHYHGKAKLFARKL